MSGRLLLLAMSVVQASCSPARRGDVWAEDAPGSIGFTSWSPGHPEPHQEHHNHRSGVRDKARLWPRGQVPYEISADFPDPIKAKIRDAMDELEASVSGTHGSCVQFTARAGQYNYLDIVKGTGCHSSIGFYDMGSHTTSLGPGCEVKGIILHELMHVLGFYHEQNRPDRDAYVRVNDSNISDLARRDFRVRNLTIMDTYNLPYDLASIMHYGPYTMAADKAYPVLTPQPQLGYEGVMGQRFGLSAIDVLKIQRQYSCQETPDHVMSVLDNLHASCAFTSDTCRFRVAPPATDTSRDTTARWARLSLPTPDGPRAGHTNGLDPFLYVTSDAALMERLVQEQKELDAKATTAAVSVTPTSASNTTQHLANATAGEEANTTTVIIPTTTTTIEINSTTATVVNTTLEENNTTIEYDTGLTTLSQISSSPVTTESNSSKVAHNETATTTPDQVVRSINANDDKTPASVIIRDKVSFYSKPAVVGRPRADNSSFSASLFSPLLRCEAAMECLEFALYQSRPGAHVTVYIAGPLFLRQPLSEYSSLQHDRWTLVRLSLHLPVGLIYQLEIQAGGSQGAVAIDDVYVFKQNCP